jgi:hypothetical protein
VWILWILLLLKVGGEDHRVAELVSRGGLRFEAICKSTTVKFSSVRTLYYAIIMVNLRCAHLLCLLLMHALLHRVDVTVCIALS